MRQTTAPRSARLSGALALVALLAAGVAVGPAAAQTTTSGPTTTSTTAETSTTTATTATTVPVASTAVVDPFGGIDTPPFGDDHHTWGSPTGLVGRLYRGLATALGPRFAGLWADHATFAFEVGVVDEQPGDAAAVRAVLGDVPQDLVEVRSSLAELSTVSRRILRLIEAQRTSGSANPVVFRNRVEAFVDPTALATEAFAPVRALAAAKPSLLVVTAAGIWSGPGQNTVVPEPSPPAAPIEAPARFTG